MSKYTLKLPKDFTRDEITKIAELCDISLDWDNTSGLDDTYDTWRYSEVLGFSVFLGIEWTGEVVFFVDGRSLRSGIPTAVGAMIWRWLIRAWEDIVAELGTDLVEGCYCFPEKSDSIYDRRVELFHKLGFSLPFNYKMTFHAVRST